MSYFVINYPLGSHASFNSVAARSSRTGLTFYAAGSILTKGLFAQTRDDGQILWFKSYTLDKRTIGFRHVLSCDNGDYILYGSLTEVSGQGSTNDRNRNIVVRVKSDGNLIWAKSYYSGRTRYNLEITKGLDDTYFFTSWTNRSGSVDDIEVIRIDGSGTVLASRILTSSSDDQVNGIVASGNGCIVFGTTGAGSGWDCFAVQLDDALNTVWSNTYGNSDFQEFRALITPDNGKTIYATGETGTNRKSFFTTFQSTATTINVSVLDELQSGNEAGFKRLLFTGPYVYLLSSPWLAPQKATLTAFGGSVGIVWHKRLSLPDAHHLLDIEVSNNDLKNPDLVLGGMSIVPNTFNKPLLVQSDKDFNTCITQSLPLPKENITVFQVKNFSHKNDSFEPEVDDWKLDVADLNPVKEALCPAPGGTGVTLDGNPRSQSPYIYLQNAGSTGADQTVPGFHLRWDLLRRLGEEHLPKGNLVTKPAYATSIAYNRPDDFVRIYRMPFTADYGVQVSFSTPPSVLNENGAVREWTWNGLVPSPGRLSSIVLRFADVNLYNALRTSLNPMVSPQQFIQQYTGRLEARIAGKLAFLVQFGLGGSQTGELRSELIGLPDAMDLTSRLISCRSLHTMLRNSRLTCENIEYVRFDYRNGTYPTSIRLAAYEDYLYATAPQWQFIGKYSLDDGLSDGNAAVFKALEDTSRFTVNRRWPKFNETGSAGEFTVSVPNYQNRWTQPQDGLKTAVITYLDASRTDTQANVVLANTGGDPTDTSTTEVSYLDMLDFVALDFHVARMLGLGTIDPLGRELERNEYVYLMQYVTTAQLENEAPALVTHYYMTPPAKMSTFKLPPPPVQLPLTYGINGDHCGVATGPTNALGYVANTNLRYININRDKFRHELPFENFFASASFCLCNETVPVLFGVEYAAGANGTGVWVRPELSHDVNWTDPGGIFEVAPIPDSGNATVYTHGETQSGVHHYALYSINWFSRISPLSNQQQTDATVFPMQNRMLPPSNLAVQLIQRETALLFTTLAEQQKRNLITTADKTLMRVLFDWNHIHSRAYQVGNKAQLLFRTQAPKVVRGEIGTGGGSVVADIYTRTVVIKTLPYTIVSTNPAQVVQPNIANATEGQRYIGGRCVIDGEPFIVDSIVSYGNDPYIRLKQIRQTISADPNGDNTFCTLENWISPQEGKRFILVENLDQNSAWDKVLTKTVDLTQFLPLHTETTTYPDGQILTETIGGLTDTATIAHIFDNDPNISNFFPLGVPPGTQVPTGGYLLTFATKQLLPHPDPEADYYQGIVRVRDIAGNIKELQVLEINNSGSTLILKAADPSFALDRDPLTGNFIWQSGNFVRVPGVVEAQVGGGKFVNYHPSYQAYFYADSPFAEAAILPAFGEGTRQTYIGIRSLDTVNNLKSYIATPAVLLALELNDPVAPLIPTPPTFATRPNYHGKATYTFDLQVQQPFALLFFRASERTILDQLYKSDKVIDILADLAALPAADAAFNTSRWSDLVNMVTESGTGLFKEYIPGGYRFPIPNNPAYSIPDPLIFPAVFPFVAGNVPPGSTAVVGGTNGMTMEKIVKDAIDGAFLPLTEEPAVYSQLKATSLQTSGRKPRLNDDSGRRLPPTDPRYDAAPMAIRYEKSGPNILLQGNAGYGNSGNQRFVRFTDYTLDGGSVNQYFYFAAEMSNRLEFSESSTVIGPIQLVNARPAETPSIKTVNVIQASTVLNRPPGVQFELEEYIQSEGIRKIAIFRAADPDDALSIRTMQFVKFVDAGEALIDDFSDLPFPLYGESIFYRLAAQREIMNEQNLPELIPSQPTDKVVVSIIDNLNPPPAEISANYTAVTLPNPQLNTVVFNWNATCYNGTYHLYKMTASGNWEKIHTATPGTSAPVSVALSATTFGLPNLPKTDSDGNTIYHRFRVQVVNSSGLVNITERELTL
jgi:hypothetical protein